MRILVAVLLSFIFQNAAAESRIKDIVYFEGIRENMLIGYGLVVGLNGTGDNLKNSAFTEKGLTDFLQKMGINARGANLKTKNIAAVTVTAALPPFARSGSKIDITVNTIGDAKSLKGGTLLATPLLGADGEVYAVAQGTISIGAKPADEDGKPESISPTAGYISAGAIIEREINFQLDAMSQFNLALRSPDISTARSIEGAINTALRAKVAYAKDPGTVVIAMPKNYPGSVLDMLAQVENVTVFPDTTAKIVIDEATGTIVIGQNVTVSRVAVSQGNIVINVSPDRLFAYEIGLAKGAPPKKSERGSEIAVFEETARLSDVVDGLNALGVRPKDLIAILKTMKQAGALHAEIVVK